MSGQDFFYPYLAAGCKAVGTAGEAYVYQQLKQAGFEVLPGRAGFGDVMLSTSSGLLGVEVKTARRSADGKFSFGINPGGNYCGSSAGAEWLVLIALAESGLPYLFVIPYKEVSSKKRITMGRDVVASKWSKFSVLSLSSVEWSV